MRIFHDHPNVISYLLFLLTHILIFPSILVNESQVFLELVLSEVCPSSLALCPMDCDDMLPFLYLLNLLFLRPQQLSSFDLQLGLPSTLDDFVFFASPWSLSTDFLFCLHYAMVGLLEWSLVPSFWLYCDVIISHPDGNSESLKNSDWRW